MLKRYFLTSWVFVCSLAGLWVSYWGNADTEEVIYATYAVLLLVGCGLGAYRTARLEGEGEIRVLAAALAYIQIIVVVRALFFLPFAFDAPANEANTWLTTLANFFTGGAICALASFGVLLFVDLAPERGGRLLSGYARVNPLRAEPKSARETDVLKIQEEAEGARKAAEEARDNAKEASEKSAENNAMLRELKEHEEGEQGA